MLKLFAKLTLQQKIKKDIAYMQHLANQDKWLLSFSTTNPKEQAMLKNEHYKKLSVINSLNQYLELIKKS